MKRTGWVLAAVSLLWGVCRVPATTQAAVKLVPGQEFLYSGVIEGKQSGTGQPVMTLTAPVKLRAIVARVNPRQGSTVILIRSSSQRAGTGQHQFPDVADVATVRFGADLKPAGTPRPNLGGPIGEVIGLVHVPLAPRAGLAVGQQWRSAESLLLMPAPIELIYRVAGKTKIGNRTCLKIDKRVAGLLPLERNQEGGSFELTDYGGTVCVEPATGLVVSDEWHSSTRLTLGEQRTSIDVRAAVALEKSRRLPAAELASNVKQAAAYGRVQEILFPATPGADRARALREAAQAVAAFRRRYPSGPYAPAFAQLDADLGRMRDKMQAEARARTLKGAPAPEFTVKDLDGKPQTLGAYRGKIILLSFFASW